MFVALCTCEPYKFAVFVIQITGNGVLKYVQHNLCYCNSMAHRDFSEYESCFRKRTMTFFLKKSNILPNYASQRYEMAHDVH